MGEISPTLLTTLKIPYHVLAADTASNEIHWAADTLKQSGKPVALLLPPGVMQ